MIKKFLLPLFFYLILEKSSSVKCEHETIMIKNRSPIVLSSSSLPPSSSSSSTSSTSYPVFSSSDNVDDNDQANVSSLNSIDTTTPDTNAATHANHIIINTSKPDSKANHVLSVLNDSFKTELYLEQQKRIIKQKETVLSRQQQNHHHHGSKYSQRNTWIHQQPLPTIHETKPLEYLEEQCGREFVELPIPLQVNFRNIGIIKISDTVRINKTFWNLFIGKQDPKYHEPFIIKLPKISPKVPRLFNAPSPALEIKILKSLDLYSSTRILNDGRLAILMKNILPESVSLEQFIQSKEFRKLRNKELQFLKEAIEKSITISNLLGIYHTTFLPSSFLITRSSRKSSSHFFSSSSTTSSSTYSWSRKSSLSSLVDYFSNNGKKENYEQEQEKSHEGDHPSAVYRQTQDIQHRISKLSDGSSITDDSFESEDNNSNKEQNQNNQDNPFTVQLIDYGSAIYSDSIRMRQRQTIALNFLMERIHPTAQLDITAERSMKRKVRQYVASNCLGRSSVYSTVHLK